jgi:hypothetical protein
VNGDYYIGNHKGGRRDGQGKLYSKNGNILYEGQWSNGSADGNGIRNFENGEKIIGQFKKDQADVIYFYLKRNYKD